jgi:hypothetical protein
MSLIRPEHGNGQQLAPAATSLMTLDFDHDLDYSDVLGMLDFGTAPPDDSIPCLSITQDEADQNDWMKVFVPSLLMTGFPRQIPCSELYPTDRDDVGDRVQPPVAVQPAALPPLAPLQVQDHTVHPPIAHHILPAYSAHSDTSFQSNPFAYAQSTSYTLSTSSTHAARTSPPYSISTLQYPFQTLDLYAHAHAAAYLGDQGQSGQKQPLTPPCPMMEYLTFPETPRPPSSAGPSGGGSGQSGTGTRAGDMIAGSREPDDGAAMPPRVFGADAWDKFRIQPVLSGPGALAGGQSGIKRKRGRKSRCLAGGSQLMVQVHAARLTLGPLHLS